MSDSERAMWVENDEWLYKCWKASCLSVREFVRNNRPLLTRYIEDQLNKPPRS